MDYYDWVAAALGKAPAIIDWKDVPNEAVTDPAVSTHAGTTRQTWVGDKVVLTRAIVRANSRGKPHSHVSEQVSMILRGGVRVHMDGTERVAMAGSIVHIPGNKVHMFEILGEDTELLDVYTVLESAEELRKHYPSAG
ncbi:MAG: cupin domain-containing protein [Burkholderiales bacterium]|nr:cupin domain-containing protein [Burkholderiales bacterium]